MWMFNIGARTRRHTGLHDTSLMPLARSTASESTPIPILGTRGMSTSERSWRRNHGWSLLRNPQGRSARECRPRGCYLVEVDDRGGISMKFEALDVVRWPIVPTTWTRAQHSQICRRWLRVASSVQAAAADGRALAVRVLLEGTGRLSIGHWPKLHSDGTDSRSGRGHGGGRALRKAGTRFSIP